MAAIPPELRQRPSELRNVRLAAPLSVLEKGACGRAWRPRFVVLSGNFLFVYERESVRVRVFTRARGAAGGRAADRRRRRSPPAPAAYGRLPGCPR